MPHKVRIALDAMGGDHGATVVVAGAELSLGRHPDTEFLLFGDRAAVEPLLDARPQLKAASRLVHTDVMVQMHDKPSQALRRGRRKSSMWLAVDAVRLHEQRRLPGTRTFEPVRRDVVVLVFDAFHHRGRSH